MLKNLPNFNEMLSKLRAPVNEKSTKGELVISKSSPFEFVEAFKSIRTNLQFASMNKSYHKIMVTSSVPGEGKSTVAVNLAVTLAGLSYRVLLIDADLRKPHINKFFGLDNGLGLSSILTSANSTDTCITNFKSVGVSVLPSGPIPQDPSELLAGEKFNRLIDQLQKQYDFIILDTPPLLVVTDAAELSAKSDGVIFVVRQNYTTYEAATRAKQNLESVGANVIGCVLNAFEVKNSNETYSYHSYKYGYKYNYK